MCIRDSFIIVHKKIQSSIDTKIHNNSLANRGNCVLLLISRPWQTIFYHRATVFAVVNCDNKKVHYTFVYPELMGPDPFRINQTNGENAGISDVYLPLYRKVAFFLF